jgi:hypothetical protein
MMRKSILMLVIAASWGVPAMVVAAETCNRWDKPSDLFSPCNYGEKAVYVCQCDASGCYWNTICYPSR